MIHRQGSKSSFDGMDAHGFTSIRFYYSGDNKIEYLWNIGSLNIFKSELNKRHPQTDLTISEHALAGLGAGMTVSFVASPIELLKARLQIQCIF